MEYKHLKDIDFASNIGNRVFGIFMARDVDVRLQKDGVTKYITFNMCDKSIKLDAKRFGATDSEIEMLKNGQVYRGAIDVKEYAKSPTGYSCIIYNFEPHEESPSNFVEWANGMDKASHTMQKALDKLSESIYGQLVANIIIPMWNQFTTWTAASSVHHDVLGGLLVHTSEVIEQAEIIAEYWEEKYGPDFVNIELLISAAMLHDIGKLEELSVDVTSGTTSYSDRASLETHITIGVSIIDTEAYRIGLGQQMYITDENGNQVETKTRAQLEYEKEALSLLKHCVLAHHGKKEWGSPISMNCPEAVILNTADGLSAEMFRFNKQFENMEPGSSHTEWVNGGMVTTYKGSNK